MKRLAWVVMALAVLLVIAAAVCAGTAIWVVGPNSGRLGGTALLLLCIGSAVGFASALALDWIEADR